MSAKNRGRAQEAASTTAELATLAEIVERFSSKKIVLFGDFVADEFQYGEISRVSREAPVLILKHRETYLVPGGGANAANNLAALGAYVRAITVVGDDTAGEALVEYFRAHGMETSGIVRAKGWVTPTKARFLAGWAHTTAQQVLRVDREPNSAPPDADLKRAHTKLAGALKNADALAISDYGFGIAEPRSLATILKRAKKPAHVTLDTRYQLNAYARVGITSATPNEAELESLHHTTIARNTAELKRCGEATLAQMKLDSLLVTRGRDGMALFERRSARVTQIPIHGNEQAVDVTGAGDTVLATYTLALTCGASFLEAAHLANIAGGLVVMKRGTATVSRKELLDAIRRDISGGAN